MYRIVGIIIISFYCVLNSDCQVAIMTSLRQPRDVAKRPMMVSHGGDGHDRLMPLLASITAGPDSKLKPSTDGAAAESSQQLFEMVEEDEEPDNWCSTDEYDTDLEQTDTNNSTDKLVHIIYTLNDLCVCFR